MSTSDALDLEVGSLLTITNPPAWLPQTDIRQIVQGWTEDLTPFEHKITYSCAPASAYDIVAADDAASRYSPDSCVTAEALDTTETGIDVTCTGKPWAHADGDYDIDIGGEVMTLTAVSAVALTQTLTVTRSVNGVVASHNSGVAVALARPVYWGL